ncbi:MAG: AAC(3) family N-acetyltransferase [Candidatus Bathyarchaeia archaeon]
MTSANASSGAEPRKVTPDELTESFEQLGLGEGDSVIMHSPLDKIGAVDGGAAMVLHRLLGVLGKGGTLLMPTFTSVTRHASTSENFTRPGCWCEGHEDRHLPFIPELQPDRNIGAIAQRLCSWPSSRRSNHPAYSFVAVGKHGDELIRDYSLDDPLLPIKRFLKQDPKILLVGVGFDSVTAIHVAEQLRLYVKFVRERALTFTSKGRTWVDITALGCSNGFEKLKAHIGGKDSTEIMIGAANSQVYQMKKLIERADSLIEKQPKALLCDNPACLSCSLVSK